MYVDNCILDSSMFNNIQVRCPIYNISKWIISKLSLWNNTFDVLGIFRAVLRYLNKTALKNSYIKHIFPQNQFTSNLSKAGVSMLLAVLDDWLSMFWARNVATRWGVNIRWSGGCSALASLSEAWRLSRGGVNVAANEDAGFVVGGARTDAFDSNQSMAPGHTIG